MKHLKREKITLALSYATYADNLLATVDRAHDKIAATLYALEPYIGRHEIVWGPAVHSSSKNEVFCDALIMITQNKEEPTEYTVAIRGTNPVSLDSFVYEDCDVMEQIWWDYGNAPSNAKISRATYTALHDLLQAESYNKHRKCKTGLVDFLCDLINQDKKKISLMITGHSLGGALAPTLALWLHDKEPFLWPNKEVDMHAYAYAGQTTGNKAFSEYLNQTLGNRCYRFANPYDIIPRLWNKNDLKSLLKLYEPVAKIGIFQFIIFKLTYFLLRNRDYTQIEQQICIDSQLHEELNIYWLQSSYQHMIPYLDEFIRIAEMDYEVTDKEKFRFEILEIFGFGDFSKPSELKISLFGAKLYWCAFTTACKTLLNRALSRKNNNSKGVGI